MLLKVLVDTYDSFKKILKKKENDQSYSTSLNRLKNDIKADVEQGVC